MTSKSLRWGILSTGRIAGIFAKGVAASRTGCVVAVGSRTQEAAEAFAATHGIPCAHGSYEAVLADPEVQAVYIATPHPWHASWAIKAARAGKHILCEKPLTLNLAEAEQVVAAAREHGVMLMEAFMYRCHPQTHRVVDMIRAGLIGEVGLVQANFTINRPFDANHRLWSNALGGGGILDLGGYPVSWARLVAGAASGQAFRDPISVSGSGCLHPDTGVDVYAAATLLFPNRVVAQVSVGIALSHEMSVRIHGTRGRIVVPSPFVMSHNAEPSVIQLYRGDATTPEEFTVTPERGLYALEADAFADALALGLREVPAMGITDTLGNMAALDAWRRAVGVVYAAEVRAPAR